MSSSRDRTALLILVAVCLPAFGATDALSDGMRKCAREIDQTLRLACFDGLAGALPKLEADEIGMTAEIAEKRRPPEQRWVKTDTVTAKIRSVKQVPRGQLIFSLDNDQVWIQDQASPNIRYSVGEEVRIEHGALTSLWLVAGHGRKTRVKRLS